MKGFTKIASIFALALMVLALPSIGSAQRRDRDRDDDYYGRNDDDYYRNGGYNNNRNIRGTVESLRNRARNFERRIDRIDDRYDNGRYGRNNNRYDNLEELSDRFSRATDDLADAYGRGRNMNNSRDEARRVLDIGSQIERALYNSRGNRNAAGEWNQISRDLRIIANAYNLNYSNGGRNQNGDWRNRVPFPLPF
ncbi:MAG TPA: hypothetical protein VMZ26_03860 [Pyrinomonadaceae bacterium]|nr:hypothetical protein [Pyrinomonadaceae bacterium]